MKKIICLFCAFLILFLVSNYSVNVKANENSVVIDDTNEETYNSYSTTDTTSDNFAYTYYLEGSTYGSDYSLEDAWYIANSTEYESGNITEEEVEYNSKELTHNKFDYSQNFQLSDSNRLYGRLQWYSKTVNTNGTNDKSDDFDEYHLLPLSNVKVALYRTDTGVSVPWATTYTDDFGNYVFTEDMIDLDSQDKLYMRVFAESETIVMSRDWIFSWLTKYYGVIEIDCPNSENYEIKLNAELKYDEDDNLYKMFNCLQLMELAERFAFDMGFQTDNQVSVVLADYDIAFCYYTFSSISSIDYYKNPDVVMHEYGHFVECMMGNYGSDLFEIILNNPEHSGGIDHFIDKSSKQYAMELTWSESWATAFAQIAQTYFSEELIDNTYLVNYTSSIEDFNDGKDQGFIYEQFLPQSYSCEANENTIIAMLWDLFDNTNEYFDTITLGYQGWWDVTSRGNVTTLTEWMEYIDIWHSEHKKSIAELMSYYKISPSDFTITNNNISETNPPEFSWVANGSTKYPNDKFEIIMYTTENRVVFESGLLEGTTYTMSLSDWQRVLDKLGANIYIKVTVAGYSSQVVQSGPYYSNFYNIDFSIVDTELNLISPTESYEMGYDAITFTWESTNIDEYLHRETYKLFIYNANNEIIFESNFLSTTSYSLTNDEWAQVLNNSDNQIRWEIAWYQETLYTIFEQNAERTLYREIPIMLWDSSNTSVTLNAGECIWLKYVAPNTNDLMLKFNTTLDINCEIFTELRINNDITNRVSIISDSNLSDGVVLEYSTEVTQGQVLYFRITGSSETVSGNIDIQLLNDHTHIYNEYARHNTSFHKVYCECGNYILEVHQTNSSSTLSNCTLCGQLLDTGGGGGSIVIRPTKEEDEETESI